MLPIQTFFSGVQAVVDSGSLTALSGCLEAFDPQVKDAAASAIGRIITAIAQNLIMR